jgi:uncharacterized repeat protein (TIGR03803 family)
MVFELTPTGSGYVETALHFFINGDGANPYSSVIADKGGLLYGTTSSGGFEDNGTVYRLEHRRKTWREIAVYKFLGGNDGSDPSGIILDNSGAFYGTTSTNGANGVGTVFKMVRSGGTYTEGPLYAFRGGNDGANPSGSLI